MKIILGGASNSRDLQDLATLIGDRDETTDSITTDVLRTLPFGTGVVMLRTARPIITTLRPWPARPDAKQLSVDRSGVEQTLRGTST